MSGEWHDSTARDVHLSKSKPTSSKHVYLFRQILITIGPFIITLVRGFVNGYSSTLIPSLKKDNFTLTTDDEAWLASTVSLPAPIGGFISMAVVHIWGRRVSNLTAIPLWIMAWLLIYFATDITFLLIARVVCGIVSGYVVVPCVILVAESTTPKYRAALLVCINLGITLGGLIIHTVGTFLTWQNTALFSALFCLPALVTLAIIPETPSWYLIKGRVGDAKKSFRWSRGTSQSEEKELEEMVNNVINKPEQQQQSLKEQLQYLFKPILLKPFGIFVVFIFTVSWSGTQAVMFFSISIAEKTFNGLDEYYTTLIMDAVRVIFSIVSCILGRYISRRSHLLVSTVATGCTLFCLAGLLYFNDDNLIDPIIIFCIMLIYVSLSNLGLLSLVYVLIGELYPLKVRALGQSLANAMAALALFSVVQAGPHMLKDIGMEGTYVVYGSLCFLGAAILFFVMPETKAKTLLEIEQNFEATSKY